MQRLPVNLLEPGMIVAREVMNNNGIILVNAGAELDGKIIMRLENMNIKKVLVEGCPVQMADYMPKSLEEKLADMEVAFSRSQEDPLMKKFRVLLKAHFIQKEKEMQGKARPASAGALETLENPDGQSAGTAGINENG